MLATIMHVSTLMQTNQRLTNAGEVYHPTLYTGGNGAALNTVNNVSQLSFLFPHFLSFFLSFRKTIIYYVVRCA